METDHKLPEEARFELPAIIVLYDMWRTTVEDRLVGPVAQSLPTAATADKRQGMIDEALVAVLRCAQIPQDGRGVLRILPPRALPEILSTWALADRADRTGAQDVVTPEQAGYPEDPEACARQLLDRWASDLLVSGDQMLEVAEVAGFWEAWPEFVTALIGGTLLGVSRQGPADVLAVARRLTAQISPRRSAIVREIVRRYRGRLAKVRSDDDPTGETLDPGLELVHHVFEQMQIDLQWSEWSTRGFTWWLHEYAQRIWAEDAVTEGETDAYRVIAETDFFRTRTFSPDIEEKLTALMAFSSLSGFVLDSEERVVRLRCSVSVHENNLEWLRHAFALAAAIQAANAQLQAEGMGAVLGLEPAKSSHPSAGPRPDPDDMVNSIDGMPGRDQPSAWNDEEEFEEAARALLDQGVEAATWETFRGLGAAGASQAPGMIIAFSVGRESSEGESKTASLSVYSDQPHPQLGNGLLMLLRLPNSAGSRPGPLELNALEADPHGASPSPFLGSWCLSPSKELTFTSFVPNVLHRRGLLLNLVLSMGLRARWTSRAPTEDDTSGGKVPSLRQPEWAEKEKTIDDPLQWSAEESERWLAEDVDSRLEDIRRLQEESFRIRPGLFNRRRWTEAAMRFTRIVLLQLRSNARIAGKLASEAAEAGRLDAKMAEFLHAHGGSEYIEAAIAGAFEQVEKEFENHSWAGSNVQSPEQATRLLFVGERVEQFIRRYLEASGLDDKFISSLRAFIGDQIRIAFTTPAGQPLPNR